MKVRISIILLIVVLLSPVVLDTVVNVFDIDDKIELTENLEKKEKESEQEEEVDVSEKYTLLNTNKSFLLLLKLNNQSALEKNLRSTYLAVFTPPPESLS